MTKNHKIAEFYFQSYHNYFWKWDTDSSLNNESPNCVTTFDDITIAYKPQLQEVIDLIREQKFPAFGAILLAFVATNIYGDSHNILNRIFDHVDKLIDELGYEIHTQDIQFEEAKKFLITLSKLGETHKRDSNRIILFATIFKKIHNGIDNKFADDIALAINNKNDELEPSIQLKPLTWSVILRDFRALGLLHRVFPNVDSVYSALYNLPNTDALKQEDPIDGEAVPKTKDFVTLLTEDAKTFFIGSLIKQLWSGLQLPYKQTHPGEMPVGGVSDITNKGDFQNILITEFANDDQTFLYRIANNEALFIRREITPEDDLRTRLFLVDTTIKNWGTPKLLNYAAAIAFVKHPKNTMAFQPFAVNTKYQPLNFETVDTVIESLNYNSAAIDAAKGIEQIINDFNEDDIEVTLFTSEKTLHHPTIKRLLNHSSNKFAYIIASDTIGNLSMYQVRQGSKHMIKRIKLPLHTLWNNPPKADKVKGNEENLNITEVNHYPILFGRIVAYKTIFYAKGNQYILHKKGYLFRKLGFNKGYKMLQAPLQFASGIKYITAATIFENLPTVLYLGKKETLIIRHQLSKYFFKGETANEIIKASMCRMYTIDNMLYISAYTYGNNYGQKYYQVFIDENEILRLDDPSEDVKNYIERYRKIFYSYDTGSVFTKIKSVGITNDLKIIFNNKHYISISDTISYTIDSQSQKLKVQGFQKGRHLLEFKDGSQIEIDPFGMLTFKSSDGNIPTFYMPSVLDHPLCLATEEVFTGNSYFNVANNKLINISIEDFVSTIYSPFIKHIINQCN